MSELEVESFWMRARDGARLAALPGYLPASSLELVPPPTWSFGDDDAADALLELVVAGRKTATASDHAAYGDQPLPEPGGLDIITDGAGHPRALVETTAVQVVAFDRVDAEHARLEGEGDLSLRYWRLEHERFFRAGGHFAPDMDIVLERFRVVYRP